MKTLMIIGAGPLQIPAYEEARRLGLRIVALDRNANAPGMKLADVAYTVDTRDAKSAIDVARRESVDGAITLCTDFPVRTVAAITCDLGLSGIDTETALRSSHKLLMRNAFALAGAPSPRFQKAQTEHEAQKALSLVGLPAIMKPTSSSGSQGIFKVTREDQCCAAFAHAQSIEGKGVDILIEEFIEGPEVSVEMVSWHGRHYVIAITDKLTTGDPYWVETGHSQPSHLSLETQTKIRDCAIAGLDALGIIDSPSHVEIKVGSHGPVLIEIGVRLGGDYISTDLALLSTGVSMPRAAIDIALGREPKVDIKFQRASAIRYIIPNPGKIVAVNGIENARAMNGVEKIEISVQPGDIIKEVCSSGNRVGYVIVAADTKENASKIAEKASKLIKINTVNE